MEIKNTYINSTSIYNKMKFTAQNPFKTNSLMNCIPNNNKNDKEKNSNSLKNKLVKLGGIGAFALSVGAFIKKTLKGSKNPNTINKEIKNLIKLLQPQDVELAKDFYPVLIENTQKLNITPQNYNLLIESIQKENRQFMLTKGISLISSKIEKIKDCIINQVDDLRVLFTTLSDKNKRIFSFVSDNIENLNISAMEDIERFLKINPDKLDYVIDTVLPNLVKNKNELNLRAAERFINLAEKINPKNEKLISEIVEIRIPKELSINKYSVVSRITDENIDCVMPLLKNSEKFQYTNADIKRILPTLTKKNAISIQSVANKITELQELNIKPEELIKHIETPEQINVFDFIMSKYKTFKIEEFSDIKYYLKVLKEEKLPYITDELLETIKQNKCLSKIECADELADMLVNIDSSTLNTIKTLSQYPEEYGEMLNYPALISAINKDNFHKLDKLMQNIKNTEVWDNFMSAPSDFIEILEKL